MRTALAPAFAAATLVVVLVRVVAAFAHRYALLATTGELERRRVARRNERVAVAVHAAVHVDGSGRGRPQSGADVDDMGLLARSMNVGLITYVAEPTPRASEFPAELFEQEAAVDPPVPIVATALGLVAVALAVPALVRPLEAWSPWCILGALVLGFASWLLARRD